MNPTGRIVRIIDNTIGKEGRYANNPHDTGGETMWGITARTARKHGYRGPMIDLPRSVAVDIYTQEYFNDPGFDRVVSVSENIAEELFDTGVNCGPRVPCVFLQRSLNTLNRSHTRAPLYPDLRPDGDIGPVTLSALETYADYRGTEGELVLLRMLNSLQGAYYVDITERRMQNEEFTYGWFLHRVVI